jgi:hypothetical protein
MERMDAPALTPAEARELADLRRRAYGPAADIGSDPGAQARLDDLQARAHGHSDTAPAATRPPAVWRRPGNGPAEMVAEAPETVPAPPKSVRPTDVSDDHVTARGDVLSDRPGEDPAAAAAGSRPFAALARVPVLGWIVIGCTLLLLLAVAWGVTQLTADRADVVLEVVDGEGPPPEYLAVGLPGSGPLVPSRFERYETYRSLEIWAAQDANGQRCLVVRTPDLERIGAGGSCVPAGLDPVYDYIIWGGLPPAVTEGLPQGTVIRFALVDGAVRVWLRTGPGPTADA